MEQKNKLYYKIYSYKDKVWKKYIAHTEEEIITIIESVFEEGTTYRVIKQYNNIPEPYAIIFNKADLEDLRSNILNKQLEKDKILEKEYIFIEKVIDNE